MGKTRVELGRRAPLGPTRIIPIAIDDSQPDAFHISLRRLQRVDFHSDPEAAAKLVQPFLGELTEMADDYDTQTARVKKRVSELATVKVPIPLQPSINVVDSLKALPRQGKLIRFKEYRLSLPTRSVLDHIFSLAHTTDVLLPYIDHRLTTSDQRRLANCITFHDLAEVLIGDYPAYTNTRRPLGYERTAEELMRLEEAANTLIRPWLGQQLLLDFDDAMSILNDSTLRLSRFVTLIDKIDPIIAIWRYLHQFRGKLDVAMFLMASDHFFSNSNVRRICEWSDIDKERMCTMIEFLQNPRNAKRYFMAGRLPGHIRGLGKGFPVPALIEGRKLTFVAASRRLP